MIIGLYICILKVLSLGIQVARKPTQQDASVQCSLLSSVVTSTPTKRDCLHPKFESDLSDVEGDTTASDFSENDMYSRVSALSGHSNFLFLCSLLELEMPSRFHFLSIFFSALRAENTRIRKLENQKLKN